MKSRFPEHVLFDLDGTLLDSLPGIEYSVRAAFAACHLPLLHEEIRQMIGPPIRTILARAAGPVEEGMLDALERAFRVVYDGEGWQKTVCFPEAWRVLRALSDQGIGLFVISNKPRAVSLRILEKERLLGFFDSIVTKDSGTPPYTNKEEMIQALLNRHEIAAARCLMVGDTMEDAYAAAKAGIRFAFMTHGYGTFAESQFEHAVWQLDSLSQLLALTESVCDR